MRVDSSKQKRKRKQRPSFVARGSLPVPRELLSAVVDLGRENDRLSWRVLQAVRYRFGRRTEQLSREDLQQLFLALGGDAETAQSPAELSVPAEPPPEQTDASTGAEASEDTP